MHKRFQPVTRVSFSRVGLIALALVALPSFSVPLIKPDGSRAVEASVLGATSVSAETAGVAPTKPSAKLNESFTASAWDNGELGGVNRDIFQMALGAAECAVKTGDVSNPATLTVIDYSRPSTSDRLWVYDLRTRKLVYKELVAHGQGSGENFATRFGNEPDTHRTSLGLFVTEGTYVGKNGYSLRLNGLDEGFNNRARERAIVMHGAPYVDASLIRTRGRLGRSWGCPALRLGIAREVIDTVKGGSLVFSYFPDKNWLKSSRYLGDCAGATVAVN